MSRIRNRKGNTKLPAVRETTKETSLPRDVLVARQVVLYHSIN
jgi:hypothetical protein